MAIMVLGVKGPRAQENDRSEQQDFLLIDSETFLCEGPEQYSEASEDT